MLALAGCTADGGTPGAAGQGQGGGGQAANGQGFVAGDGSITQVAAAERKRAPALTGTTLEGQPFALADHAGKVVVLNAWASWCGPCREEAPALQRAWQSLRGQDVQFVGINTRDNAPPAQAYQRTFDITYPSVSDEEGLLTLAFRDSLPMIGPPTTVIVDRQGRVASRVLGATSEKTLRDLINDVLAEPA